MNGQSSGAFRGSSSALRVLHTGIYNGTGILCADAFTQTNPPKVTTAGTISAKVVALGYQTRFGVLGGSVAFSRPDAGSVIGGPGTAGDGARAIGVFCCAAMGNPFENQPGVASGRGTYLNSGGHYANALYETQVLTSAGKVGNALTPYAPGQRLFASRNGYLTNAVAADFTVDASEQCYEGNPAVVQSGVNGEGATLIGVVTMAPDTVQNEVHYDGRI